MSISEKAGDWWLDFTHSETEKEGRLWLALVWLLILTIAFGVYGHLLESKYEVAANAFNKLRLCSFAREIDSKPRPPNYATYPDNNLTSQYCGDLEYLPAYLPVNNFMNMTINLSTMEK